MALLAQASDDAARKTGLVVAKLRLAAHAMHGGPPWGLSVLLTSPKPAEACCRGEVFQASPGKGLSAA